MTAYKPFVVGLRGVAGAGKSTLAKMLRDRAELDLWDVYVKPMAEPLKRGLAVMGITKEKTPELYRKAAQIIGTDILRHADPDHWVNLFRFNTSLPSYHRCIILVDDIRFPNEAQVCDLVLFIEPEFPCLDLKDRATHESETWNLTRSGRIDHVIRNPKDNPHQAVDEILGLISSHLLQQRTAA